MRISEASSGGGFREDLSGGRGIFREKCTRTWTRDSEKADRFCVFVSPEGCDYINLEIPVSEFLEGFLKVLKTQDMQQVRAYFQAFAKAHGTTVCEEDDEEDLGTVLSFADKDVEPYLYCVTDDQFGITYHRFTKDDFDTI